MLNAAIESLVSKVQNGVVIQFEKIGPDPPLLPNELNKLENESMKGNEHLFYVDVVDSLMLLNTKEKCRPKQICWGNLIWLLPLQSHILPAPL